MKDGRGKAPGRWLEQGFQIGGYPFENVDIYVRGKLAPINLAPGGSPLANSSIRARVLGVFDDVASITKLHVNGVSTISPNLDRWLPVGAQSMFLLAEQPVTGGPEEWLRVLHGASVTATAPPPLPGPSVDSPTSTVCLTFFDLGPQGSQSAPEPLWIRSRFDIKGRYAFGASFALADDRVVIQGTNDLPVAGDGIIWTNNLQVGSGSVDIIPNPTPLARDERLDGGIVFTERNQWLESPTELWLGGDRTTKDAAGLSGIFWAFGKHIFGPTSANPTVALAFEEYVDAPWDRFAKPARKYYMGVSANADWAAFTAANAPQVMPEDPDGREFIGLAASNTPDGGRIVARNLMIPDIVASPTATNAFVEPGNPQTPSNPWLSFRLNTHPEWNNVPFDRSVTTGPRRFSYGAQFYRSEGRLVDAQLCRTWPPLFFELPTLLEGVEDRWVTAVPCGFACCPPNLSKLVYGEVDPGTGLFVPGDLVLTPADIAANVPPPALTLLLPVEASFNPTSHRASQFRKGVVQLWDMSNPWDLARDAVLSLPPNPPVDIRIRPPGSTTLDPLYMTRPGSNAFELKYVQMKEPGGGLRDMLFVVDFGGGIDVFDITGILDFQFGPRYPIHSWQVPDDADVMENLRPNIYDVEVDLNSAKDRANVYIAASRVGMYIVAYEIGTGFSSEQDSIRVKMPGQAHSCVIRDGPDGKLLLVDDLSGGYRFYR